MGCQGAIILKIGAGRVIPSGKVYKRLTNGPEDNVAFYFQVIKTEALKENEQRELS